MQKALAEGKHVINKGNFSLRAPIYNPEKVVCIGMNYVDHCTEQNIPVPEEPVIFSKFGSAITEPNGDVVIPANSQVANPPPTQAIFKPQKHTAHISLEVNQLESFVLLVPVFW